MFRRPHLELGSPIVLPTNSQKGLKQRLSGALPFRELRAVTPFSFRHVSHTLPVYGSPNCLGSPNVYVSRRVLCEQNRVYA